MKSFQLLAAAAIAVSTVSAAELKVDQYEGPTECEDDKRVKKGDHVKMHYTGTIDESSETGEKGKKFDSSRDRNQPFDTAIGVGQVIKGWDEGVSGLCVGAKAKMVIPPEMGYGEQGAGGDIPGGATLNFDVEVIEIMEGAPPPPNFFSMIDTDEDGALSKEEIEAYFLNMEGGGGPVPDGLWEREDTDKDGKITWDEFSGPKGSEAPSAKEEL
mmetsp:Transcript_3284/g.3635  ORF Transcript_3284/g.3635 Transcript_3284/m.3635 type:complete len:214 (+) Transcript_3284:51-692(+)|eukprot:CAMPEP_0171314316 /NCGR_PEP_ID=MMETSP0816-20121228/50231_1 /TAXON_ID=420281 /ORGANISM="Proboscia inermis, Strain CCAP1064/1" /LENGTH=213 /DNA_ID=CAMNT_0011803071 /DNA_START=18 /DNA_END=659 /DNA_ORIENTATION=-